MRKRGSVRKSEVLKPNEKMQIFQTNNFQVPQYVWKNFVFDGISLHIALTHTHAQKHFVTSSSQKIPRRLRKFASIFGSSHTALFHRLRIKRSIAPSRTNVINIRHDSTEPKFLSACARGRTKIKGNIGMRCVPCSICPCRRRYRLLKLHICNLHRITIHIRKTVGRRELVN